MVQERVSVRVQQQSGYLPPNGDGACTVVTCLYGNEFAPLLLSFLESWRHVSTNIIVGYYDIHTDIITAVAEAYPEARFVHQASEIIGKKSARISSKLRYWKALSHEVGRESSYSIFADIDTVAIDEVKGIAQGDINVTVRRPTSKYFLNSGILGISNAALASSFFSDWLDQTEAILKDPNVLTIATSSEHHFGGGDQMALMLLLGVSENSRAVPCYGGLSVRYVECDEYNACENTIDIRKAKIIHLKASLQNYLLRRTPLVGERRAADSHAQLSIALASNRLGLARLGDVHGSVKDALSFRTPRAARLSFEVPLHIRLPYQLQKISLNVIGKLKKVVQRASH